MVFKKRSKLKKTNKKIKSIKSKILNEDIFYKIEKYICSKKIPKEMKNLFLKIKENKNIDDPIFTGFNPLHLAIERRFFKLVRLLVNSGCDVNKRITSGMYKGKTPIFLAIENNDMKILKFLISKGADIECFDWDNRSVLDFAVLRANQEIIDYLISKGADVNKANQIGWTPLHYAVIRGDINLIEFLISKGAKMYKNNNGKTPLDIALKMNKIGIANYLKKYSLK